MSYSPAMRRSPESGFSIIELLVAMLLLTLLLLGLVPLSLKVSRMSTQSTALTQRSAALGGEVQRLETLPFDSLAAGTTCASFVSSSFPHTNCVTVSIVNPKTKRLTVVVTPTGGVLGADSTVIERSRGSTGNPLNLP